MRKATQFTLLFTAALVFSGSALAQTSAAPAQSTPAGQTPAAKKPATTTGSATKAPAAPLVLKTQKEKQSYAIGMSIAKGMKSQNLDVDTAVLMRAIKDQLAGAKPAMTEEEAQQVLTTMEADMRKKQQEKMAAAADTNKKEGDAFLAANKTKPGVVTTPSGLQYKVIQQGSGPKPTVSDVVECNYRGTLINGKEFDSSAKHGGQPATFPVGQIIKGWTEALQLMPVGSKYELFIPPDLAYGGRQAGPDIGPNSTLIFDVELVAIKPKEAPAAAPGAAPPAGQPQSANPPQGKP